MLRQKDPISSLNAMQRYGRSNHDDGKRLSRQISILDHSEDHEDLDRLDRSRQSCRDLEEASSSSDSSPPEDDGEDGTSDTAWHESVGLLTGKTETNAMRRSKIVVYFVLVVAATALGTVTYVLLSHQQTVTFESQV